MKHLIEKETPALTEVSNEKHLIQDNLTKTLSESQIGYWSSLESEQQDYLNSLQPLTKSRVPLLEAIEIFSDDAKPVLIEKQRCLSDQENHFKGLLEVKVAAASRTFKYKDEFTNWFLTRMATYRTAFRLADIKREKKNIDRALLLLTKGKNKDWESKVETARQIPVEELFAGKLKKVSKTRLVGLCPLHQEKTPSFTIYTHNNSWYCYGCSQGGDVLNLLMRLEKLEFKDAVRRLA
jgi:hypothetical protein